MAPEDAVNLFLHENFGLDLEEVLTLGIEKRTRPELEGRVSCTGERVDYCRDEDGGVIEFFEGVLAIDGVRYAWQASVYTDLDGDRFVAHLGGFVPLDWRAGLRVGAEIIAVIGHTAPADT